MVSMARGRARPAGPMGRAQAVVPPVAGLATRAACGKDRGPRVGWVQRGVMRGVMRGVIVSQGKCSNRVYERVTNRLHIRGVTRGVVRGVVRTVIRFAISGMRCGNTGGCKLRVCVDSAIKLMAASLSVDGDQFSVPSTHSCIRVHPRTNNRWHTHVLLILMSTH